MKFSKPTKKALENLIKLQSYISLKIIQSKKRQKQSFENFNYVFKFFCSTHDKKNPEQPWKQTIMMKNKGASYGINILMVKNCITVKF